MLKFDAIYSKKVLYNPEYIQKVTGGLLPEQIPESANLFLKDNVIYFF